MATPSRGGSSTDWTSSSSTARRTPAVTVGNFRPALAAAPSILDTTATDNGAGGIRFDAHVAVDPAAGIQDVWIAYTFGTRWDSIHLTLDPADPTHWSGVLTHSSAGLKYVIQSVNGVGMVSLDANGGAFYGIAQPTAVTHPTTLAVHAAATHGVFGSTVSVTADLSGTGNMSGKAIQFGLGGASATGTTDSSGHASATLALNSTPGAYSVTGVFQGDTANDPSSDVTPFTIDKLGTTIAFTGSATSGPVSTDSGVVATLKDANNKAIAGRTVWFVVTDGGGNAVSRSVLTSSLGQAKLGVIGLPAGSYTIAASFGGPVTLQPGSVHIDLTDTTYGTSTATLTPYAITKKAATIGYTGNRFWSAGTGTTASVLFTGQVTPAVGGTLPASNVVDFQYFSSATPTVKAGDCVGTIDDTGLATCTKALGLDDWIVVMTIPATNGYYTAPDADSVVVTVYQTTAAKYATGAGHVIDPSTNNIPVKVSPTKNKGTFGFAVSYKTGTTPQGIAIYSFRGNDGYDYIFTTTSWTGGGLSFGTSATTASFSSKCAVTVINPATRKVVSGLGGTNFTCRYDVTDGSTDKFAMSAYTSTGVLYHQVGTASSQIAIGSGGIVVKK